MSVSADSDPTAVVVAGGVPPTPSAPPPPEAPPPPSEPAVGWKLRDRDGLLLAEIAGITYDKSVTRRLNRPAFCSFRVPSDSDLIWSLHTDGKPYLCAGYRRMMVTLECSFPDPYFNGIVWSLEDDGDEDISYTRVTCFDPSIMWGKRPARDPDGDFTDPTFMRDFDTGPQIMQSILFNSEDTSGGGGSPPPDFAEGDLFLDIVTGNWPGGGVSLAAAPMNFPQSIGEVAVMLTNSGQLDIVIVPVDDGMIMGRVDTYHGNFGTDRTATVHFDYATGDFNARNLRRTEDMTDTANKIWKYLGSREDIQHWRANVTGDDPLLPGNISGGSGIGGALPDRPSYAGGALGDLIAESREGIGVLMEIQIADDQGSEDSVRPLERRLWQMESLFRVNPRKMIYLTPVRDGEFGPCDFDIGDLISINVGTKAREAVVSQVQRIYSLQVTYDDDGVEALGELGTSPDMEAAS